MMRLNTTGHAAWIVAAGFWVCAAALFPTSHAAAQDAAAEQPAVGTAIGVAAEPNQPTRLHPKKSASKPRKTERHAKAKKPAPEETAKADDLKPTQDDAITPAVANANAQWANDAKPTYSYNISAQAGTVLSQMGAQAEPAATATPDDGAAATQLVASDQLNDLDRAAEEKPPLTLAKATIDTPPAPEAAAADNNTPWTQTSMIGKIFIALGGMLTLASAARMFMA